MNISKIMHSRTVWICLAVLFIVFLAVIIDFADRGVMPAWIAALYHFPNGDKVGHFLLMGILAFLVNLSLSSRRVALLNKRFLLGSLLVAGTATLEELSQSFFPTRTCSLLDLGSSYLGIALLGWLAGRMGLKTASAEKNI